LFVVFCAPRSARRRELAATAKTRPAPTVVLPKTAHKNTSPQTPGSPPLPHAASSLRSSPRSGGAPGAASVCAPPPDPAQKKTFVILSEAKDLLFAQPQPRHTRKRREARRVGPSRSHRARGRKCLEADRPTRLPASHFRVWQRQQQGQGRSSRGPNQRPFFRQQTPRPERLSKKAIGDPMQQLQSAQFIPNSTVPRPTSPTPPSATWAKPFRTPALRTKYASGPTPKVES